MGIVMSRQTVIHALSNKLGQLLLCRNLQCVVAESCTGGAVAGAITDIPGSSRWFDRGFVTYSIESKQQMLGVSASVIASEGAVSEAVVRAMAEGALAASSANVSIAISGIAGPGGDRPDKPVGTVWMAWASDLQPPLAQCYLFTGNRLMVRKQAVQFALQGLIQYVENLLCT
jgi:nicotinamide-nucleotide amidase